MFRNKISEPCWIPEEPHQGVYGHTIGAGRGCERGFTSRPVAAPAEERHLSQNTLTAYRSASHLLLITKNPRDGDLGRRQRWLPERVDKVIAFDRLAL
jgi:hypothetical protein